MSLHLRRKKKRQVIVVIRYLHEHIQDMPEDLEMIKD